jgi:hypothetical protein
MNKKPIVAKPQNDLISNYWSRKERKAANPTEAFKTYCELNPSALECREYDV